MVFLAQVPAVALPLLLPVLKQTPGPPKPPPKPPEPLRINRFTQNAVENSLYSVLCHLKVGFFLITHTEPHRFRPELVGKLRMGLPQLPKQLRDQKNSQKHEKN